MNEEIMTNVMLEWRCWRCGETPRSGVFKVSGERGLTCACRGYVLSKRRWRSEAAVGNRPFLPMIRDLEKINLNYWGLPEASRAVYVNLNRRERP